MTVELFHLQASTLISVPGGFTCPRCHTVHFLATNRDGQTYCPTCLPTKEERYASQPTHSQR